VAAAFEDALLHQGEAFVEDDLSISHGVYLLCCVIFGGLAFWLYDITQG
jgi:hypothetical protein